MTPVELALREEVKHLRSQLADAEAKIRNLHDNHEDDMRAWREKVAALEAEKSGGSPGDVRLLRLELQDICRRAIPLLHQYEGTIWNGRACDQCAERGMGTNAKHKENCAGVALRRDMQAALGQEERRG